MKNNDYFLEKAKDINNQEVAELHEIDCENIFSSYESQIIEST